MSEPGTPKKTPRTALVVGSILGVGVLVCGGGGLLAAAIGGGWWYLHQPQAVSLTGERLLVDSAQGAPLPLVKVQRRRGEPEDPAEPVTWTVEPADLGAVRGGVFVPDHPGDGKIQACTEGICGALPVHVVFANTVTIDPDRALIRIWGPRALKATALFEGAPVDVPITWTSSDPKVATVDAAGNVNPAGAGTAEITATGGGASGKATVRVLPQPPTPCTLTSYADAIGRKGDRAENRACENGQPDMCWFTASQELADGGRIDETGGYESASATLWLPANDPGQAVEVAKRCAGLPPEVTALPLLEYMQGATPGEQNVQISGQWEGEDPRAHITFRRGQVSVDLPVACMSNVTIAVEGNWIKVAQAEGC